MKKYLILLVVLLSSCNLCKPEKFTPPENAKNIIKIDYRTYMYTVGCSKITVRWYCEEYRLKKTEIIVPCTE